MCHKMKTVNLETRIEGHLNDGSVFVEYPDDIKVRSLEHATRVVPSFMEQLGSLTELERLQVSLNCAYRCASFHFCILRLVLRTAWDSSRGSSNLNISRPVAFLIKWSLPRSFG